jgi:hypothetical protein
LQDVLARLVPPLLHTVAAIHREVRYR